MRSATKLVLGIACATAASASGAAGALVDVPASETAGYQPVYNLNIPTSSPGWNTAGTLTGASGYSVNNSAAIANGSFTRVAYYFELGGATAAGLPNGWVYVSFDAAGFTNRADRLGVPSTNSGAFYQQNVANMNVYSNVAGIVTGTGIQTGNVEFWPSDYNRNNTRNPIVPNASSAATNDGFDWGDGGGSTAAGHGSMQIHNYDLDGAGAGTAGQTLFGYSAWGAARVSELGIGNNPTAGQGRDWTLTANAGSWTTKNLQVLVLVPEPSTLGVAGAAAVGFLSRRRRSRR